MLCFVRPAQGPGSQTEQRGVIAEKRHGSSIRPPPSVPRTGTATQKTGKETGTMEHKCKRFLSLLLALAMVIGLMPMTSVRAEEAAVYQISDTAATDLGLNDVGDSARFVIVSAVTPTREMIANPATLSNGYAGLELAARSGAENAIWTITRVDGGYTVSNGPPTQTRN